VIQARSIFREKPRPTAGFFFKRAGADGVLTYFARDVARIVNGQP